MDLIIAKKLLVAVGLGLLVGFQREWTDKHVAGIRTFALITLLGTLLGLNADGGGEWPIAAGLVVVGAVIIVGGIMKFQEAEDDDEPGLTTQVAALVMYAVGVAVALDRMALGIIVGGGTAVLLHWKRPLHAFVDRLGETDVRAIIELSLIALVVLPLLPNESLGPYGVLNPFEIWMMVVLIVGISLVGYVAYRLLGTAGGTIVGGVLGGLISSTATTVSYSRRARRFPGASAMAALVIMIASTIVFARVFVEVAVVSPEIVTTVMPPLAAMMALMIILAAVLYGASQADADPIPVEDDPSQLPAAIVFGMLYAGVLFAVAAARQHLGDQALYAVAALSGLTDMDAITLSTAQMIKKGRLEVATGWRMILIGAMSNLVFKGAVVAVLGNRALFVRIVLAFSVALVGGAAILAFWPLQ